MKIFAIILTVCVASTFAGVLTDEQKVKLRQFKLDCIAETGVSAEAVENAKMGVFAGPDEKLNCFALCFMKKTGFINADGGFDEANFRARVPPNYPKEEVDKIVEKCKPLSGANACETAGKLFKCYLENKSISILN